MRGDERRDTPVVVDLSRAICRENLETATLKKGMPVSEIEV